MLDTETKRRIDTARDILVGKVPDPKSQVEQITIALIYKFMDDMDKEAVSFGGKATFFTGDYDKYSWTKIFDTKLGGVEMLNLYSEAILKLNVNPNVPQLFRDIFKNAYLPYRDPETLKLFLKTINEFSYDHSERLGDAFEYLLSVLGSQGDAGQFRTPRHIIDFIVAVLAPQKGETICDPACGTAGFLISSYKYILNHNTNKNKGDQLNPADKIKLMQNFVGYDISPDMVRLSLVNMYLHGFTTPKIYEYDTLTSEDRWNEYYDVILANPPFMSPKGGIKPHKKFSVQASKSEVLFTDYIAEHINPSTGRAGLIVPNGIVATSQTAYKELRKLLVKQSLIAVISLPAGCFQPYSGVKTSILILDRRLSKKTDNILFVKVTNDGFGLGAQRREIEKDDLPSALQIITEYKTSLSNNKSLIELPSIAALVPKETIFANKDIVLSAERYVKQTAINTDFDLVRLDDVSEIIRGITFGRNDQLESENENTIRVATTKASQENGIDEDELYFIPKRFVKDEKKYLQENDILISTANSLNLLGRTTFVGKLNYKASFGAFMSLIRANIDKVLPVFLLHCLKTDIAKKYFELNANTTTNISNLTFESLKDFEIPLPPIKIQRQIVNEIEGYQKIIDGAKQIANNYKPSITINPDWEMVELGEACELNPQKSELKSLSDKTIVSFVPMADLNENEANFIPKEARPLSEVVTGYTYFKNGDVLVAKVTPCFENGKAGIANHLDNGIGFGSSEYYVLRSKSYVLPMWIYLQIKSDKFKKEGKQQMSGTSGLQRIPKDFVNSFLIPIPSIEEQQAIVNSIEEEMQIVEQNKRLIQLFEAKIKNKIAQVWGVKEEVESTVA